MGKVKVKVDQRAKFIPTKYFDKLKFLGVVKVAVEILF
jgi:hypothetical protein